jgi:hypothetical protein
VNQRSEHLSDAQIEQYGKRASGAGPETEARVETHLDDCPSCRSRVLEFQRTQFALLPDPKVITVSSSSCPSEQDLRNLAAGLCSGPLAAELTAHAAACGRCGLLLREYQEDFSDDVTPEEQTALAQLRSASPEWQRKKAREMLKQVRTTVPRPSPRWTFTWRWALIRLRRDRHQHLVHPARHAGESGGAAGPGVHGAAADGIEVARSSMGTGTNYSWP